jgi:hypothetical protein
LFHGGEAIDDYYYPQLQMQMAVCNIDTAIFVRYRPLTEDSSGLVDITHFKFNGDWWKRALERFEKFYASMCTLRAMPQEERWAAIKGDKFRGPGAKRLWMQGRSIRGNISDEGEPPLKKRRKKEKSPPKALI